MKFVTPTTSDLRPLYRWLLWILGGILVLLIILQLLLTFFADDYVASRLKEGVRQKSNGTYALQFDDLDLNIFGESASIYGIKIKADTSAFSQAASEARPSGMLFSGAIKELDVSGVNLVGMMMGRGLHISAITIHRPDLTLRQNPNPLPDDTTGHPFSSVDSSLYAAFSGQFPSLTVDQFDINQARAVALKAADTLAAFRRFDLNLKTIHIDSASARSGRLFVTDNGSLRMQNFMINLPDGLNKMRFKQLTISSDNQTADIDSMQLLPRYPRFEFSKHKGTQIDRINLQIPEINVNDINYSLLVDSSRFHAVSISINDANMDDFRSKIPPFPSHHYPPLPHMALKRMKFKLKIDSIRVNRADIAYSEYHAKAPRAGKVTFNHLNATIQNVTNYPDLIDRGAVITMDARARVMNSGLLQTHFTFPMDTESGFHKVRGKLGRIPMTAFNPILEYVAFVRVDTGTLNSLDFDMTLNGQSSSGSLIMNYEDFKVSMLDKESMKQKGILNNLKSFAANKLIIKKNNTPEGGMRSGTINFDRIQKKGVFNYWWKSLLSGIKQSIK